MTQTSREVTASPEQLIVELTEIAGTVEERLRDRNREGARAGYRLQQGGR